MVKFLKFERDGRDFIIGLSRLVFVDQRSAKTTLIFSDEKGTGQSSVVFPTAALTSAEQLEQNNAMVEAISEALKQPWTQPYYTLTLPHPLNGPPEFTAF
jgi:hypothetical protein